MREIREQVRRANWTHRGNEGGFGLIEMLVAVTIVIAIASLLTPVLGDAMRKARQAECLSNQRQIGLALNLYAADYAEYPLTTCKLGPLRTKESWIYTLGDYLDSVDRIRICPADPPARQKKILKDKATSYVLNDLVFDSEQFRRPSAISLPAKTLLLTVLSENRTPSTTRDHIHGDEWSSWGAALDDIEPDRHRRGGRSKDRLKGTSNYLFADGSARSISAEEFKSYFDQGINPAEVPVE